MSKLYVDTKICQLHGRKSSPQEVLRLPGGRETVFMCDECLNPEKFLEENLAEQGIIIGNI